MSSFIPSSLQSRLARVLHREERVGGLSITDDAIALVYLDHPRDVVTPPSVLFQKEVPLPTGVVVDGVLMKPDELSRILRDFFSHKLPSHSVVLSLPSFAAQPFVFSFSPTLQEQEIKNAIELTIDSAIPLARRDSYVDWEAVPASDFKKKRVLLAMGVKRIIDPYFHALKQAGFVPVVCETHGWGISRGLHITEPTLVIQFTSTHAFFYAYNHSLPLFQFDIPFAHLSFSDSSLPISTPLPTPPVSPEEPPSLPSVPVAPRSRSRAKRVVAPASRRATPKRRTPRARTVNEVAPPASFVASAPTPDVMLHAIARYTSRIFRFLISDPEYLLRPSRIILLGDSASVQAFPAFLSEEFRALLIPNSRKETFIYTLASAAAFRGITPRHDDHSSSLMPIETQIVYEQQRLLSFLRFFQKLSVALGGFFILFFSITFLFINSVFMDVTQSSLYEGALVNPEEEVLRVHALEVNTYMERFSQLLARNPHWDPFLKEFRILMNDAITLSHVEVGTSGSVSFSGIAKDRNALLALRDTLDRSSVFTPITLPLSLLLGRENISFSFTVQLTQPDMWHQ